MTKTDRRAIQQQYEQRLDVQMRDSLLERIDAERAALIKIEPDFEAVELPEFAPMLRGAACELCDSNDTGDLNALAELCGDDRLSAGLITSMSEFLALFAPGDARLDAFTSTATALSDLNRAHGILYDMQLPWEDGARTVNVALGLEMTARMLLVAAMNVLNGDEEGCASMMESGVNWLRHALFVAQKGAPQPALYTVPELAALAQQKR